MNISPSVLVDAANGYQKSYKSVNCFISYKRGFKSAKKSLKTKFKLFCMSSPNIDMEKTIKKAQYLYGEKVASKMREWCKKTKIKQ